MNKIPLTKKKSKYNNLDNFLLNNETQIIDLHDTLLDKYAYLGYLNKSKIENFVNLIIHNSILKDIKRPSDNIDIKDDENDDFTEYNNEIVDDYYF